MIDTFSLEFRNAYYSWRLRFNEEMAKSGFTATKSLTLIHLADSDKPMTQKELAQRLFIEEPSVVRLLDKLEEAGLVRRQAGIKDRRTKFVMLEDKAIPLIETMRVTIQAMRRRAMADITPENMLVAIEVMRKISENLG